MRPSLLVQDAATTRAGYISFAPSTIQARGLRPVCAHRCLALITIPDPTLIPTDAALCEPGLGMRRSQSTERDDGLLTDGVAEYPERQKSGAGQLRVADGGDLEFEVACRAPPGDGVAHFGADERASQG